MASVMLLYVGAVLFCNGLWLLGHIEDKEIKVIDTFVGGLGLVVVLLFLMQGTAADFKLGAQLLLFAFTYLWVAWNRVNGADGRGLGWFCLFVAVTAIPTGFIIHQGATTTWLVWLALDWYAWGILWFMFFLLLAMKKDSILRLTGWVTLLQGIFTAWLPGFLLLEGYIG
jgi:hypothetical protein